jgi:hypothetical protein
MGIVNPKVLLKNPRKPELEPVEVSPRLKHWSEEGKVSG